MNQENEKLLMEKKDDINLQIGNDKEIVVYACYIDLEYLYYKCPFELKKIHLHGSNGDLRNREEYRGGHGDCKCTNLKIVIGDFTKRGTLNKNGYYWKEEKRSIKKMNLIHQLQIEGKYKV